jgi:hypothetical protein
VINGIGNVGACVEDEDEHSEKVCVSTFVGSWGVVLVVIIEAGRHGNESRFCGGGDTGLFGALGYMAELT